MDPLTFVPIVEVLETGLSDQSEHKATARGEHPECTLNHCQLAA